MAEVIIVENAQFAGEIVADAIVRLIQRKGDAVLGLATGSTPLPVYRALAEKTRDMDLSRVSGFALDEYVGLPISHAESYRSVITREVVEPLGMNPALVHVPDGEREFARTSGEDFEAKIRDAGGIDIQILGIGTEGHIGFNEPGSSFASRTRIKTLTRQTRRDNARFFDSPDQVPTHSITQGLGTILEAKHLVLLAFGEAKAAAITAALEGPVSASMPASAIQLHPHVTVVLDEHAARGLRYADYYRDSYETKPEWQEI